MFEIVVDEDELMRELTGLTWPASIEEMEVDRPYPYMACLSRSCTVVVNGDARVH